MAKYSKHYKKRIPSDWTHQPIATWLKSDRRELNHLYIARLKPKRRAQAVAWATDMLSQKSLKLSLKVVPIDNLRNSRYELIRPLWITLEYENDKSDVVTATCYDAAGVFGYGNSDLEAMEDLCKSILEIYDDLFDTNNESLGPAAKQLKDFLIRVIRKVDAA